MPHLFGSSDAPRPERWFWRKRVIVPVLLGLMALGYGTTSVAIQYSAKVLPGNAIHLPGPIGDLPYLAPPTPTPGGRINILIMGIDQRPGQPSEFPEADPSEQDPGRTDTMAVLSIEPATKTATVLSIPRDLWLEIPDGKGGWTLDRINDAYATGESDKLPGGGPASAAAAVTHNFGIHIDHYVVIDFKGFMQVVDALGGVDITVPKTITSTVLPEADNGGYEFTFFAGHEHLNGELALAYSRFRNDPEGDLGRIQRQQQVALAAGQKALSLGWLSNALELWNKYNSAVETDISGFQIPGFALLAKQVQSHGIVTRSLGESGATKEAILPSGADVLFPDPFQTAEIIGEAFNDPALRKTAYTQLSRIYPPPGAPTAAVPGELPPTPANAATSEPQDRSPAAPTEQTTPAASP